MSLSLDPVPNARCHSQIRLCGSQDTSMSTAVWTDIKVNNRLRRKIIHQNFAIRGIDPISTIIYGSSNILSGNQTRVSGKCDAAGLGTTEWGHRRTSFTGWIRSIAWLQWYGDSHFSFCPERTRNRKDCLVKNRWFYSVWCLPLFHILVRSTRNVLTQPATVPVRNNATRFLFIFNIHYAICVQEIRT